MDNTPQFGTAEYSNTSAGGVCKVCQAAITGAYYRANTAVVCSSCAGRLQHQMPQDSHSAFVRGLVFGLGGCVLGLILYAGFTILTGIEIGFVSLAVGWLVGKAIMLGSGGIGGRRYQIAAVLLTYAAVSLAFIPIVLHYMHAHSAASSEQNVRLVPPVSKSGNAPATQQTQPTQDQGAASAKTRPKMSRLEALGKLTLIGLASPFIELSSGVSGIIGLFILFIGMRFAWRITRGVRIAISGPYEASASAKA